MVGTANWYFKGETQDFETRGQIRPINGLWLALRYHFGSICFGSIVIAFTWPFSRLLHALEDHMRASVEGNTIMKTCLCCTSCCLNCFKRFIQVMNMNSYVHVALTGESFCNSGVNAKALQLKSSQKFIITNGVGSFITVTGKLFIAVSNSMIGLIMIETQDSISTQLEG